MRCARSYDNINDALTNARAQGGWASLKIMKMVRACADVNVPQRALE